MLSYLAFAGAGADAGQPDGQAQRSQPHAPHRAAEAGQGTRVQSREKWDVMNSQFCS